MTCLSTTIYQLINGNPTNLIQPRRRIRLGYPLSQIIFTLCMEYFSIAMRTNGEHPCFKIHSKCRTLKIIHLCFEDDLLMFYKGDMQFIKLVLEGFRLFSSTIVCRSTQINLQCTGVVFMNTPSRKLQLSLGFSLVNFPSNT